MAAALARVSMILAGYWINIAAERYDGMYSRKIPEGKVPNGGRLVSREGLGRPPPYDAMNGSESAII